VQNGTLQISNSVAIPGNDLTVASTGTLDLNANSSTVGALTGSGTIDDVASGGTVTFTLGNNGNGGTFSGVIKNTTGTVNLAKNGNGTQILTGNNTFSGTAVVNGGTLQLNSGGVINNAAADGTGTANGNGQMLVSGGSLSAASFNVATPSVGLAVSSGSATFSGALTMNAANGSQASQNGLITVTGSGSLSAASLAMGRMGTSITAQPTTGATGYGFYVNGGTANISGDVSVCTQGAANSGNSMRIDSGSFTVGGLVTLAGGTSGGRWSVMDVNGGTFEVDNTASGFNVGGNNGGNATLFVRAGVAKIGKVTLGNSGQTGNTVALTMTGGSLYVGSGGIVSALNVLPANSPITMTNATLGAWADWSSTNAIFLNGTNTIKAADDSGTARNIALTGPVGGNFNSAITKTGNGTLTLSGANFFTNGVTVSAGKVNINGYNALGGAFYGGLTLAGGTLQYSTNSTGNGSLDISLLPNGEVGVTLASGTDTIDVNGNSVTYASPIGNGGGGSLVVQSTVPGGVLNLTTNNTYTGNTTVSSGALRANNTTGSATGSGNVTVNSGGTLGGGGIISGAVEIASGGTNAPGNSVGNLTVGSLQLDAGANCNYEFNLTTNDLVVSTGGLTVNGGAFNLYAEGGTSPWTTVGTYKLVSYTGADPSLDSTWTTTSGSNPHILHPYPICLYSFAASGGYLTLTITLNPSSVAGTWTNNANGNWSSAANWDSNPSIPHSIGDTATLGNSTAQRTVTLDANETAGSVTFNNANSFVIANGGNTLTLNNSGFGANIYVLDGTANAIQTAVALNDNTVIAANSGKSVSISGNISGSSVTVNGAGTVALSGNNSHSGTTLGGGTLQVGNNNALGSGDLSVTANGTLQAGTAGLVLGNNVQVASGATATVDTSGQDLEIDGNISIPTTSGSLAKIGNGKLTLTGIGGFSGITTISGGVLAISTSLSLLVTPTIILNGGVLLGDTGIDQDGPNANIGIGPLSGGTGGTGLLDAASAQTFIINGAIGSAGNSGVNNLVINSLTGDNGTVMLAADNSFNGTTVISNGVLLLETSGGLQNSTLNYNNQGGALHFDTGVGSATLGGLMGGQDLGLTNLNGTVVALTVGGNGASTVYSGGLQDNGMAAPLTKAGNGTLALAGTNNCGGTATISAGQLQVTNNGVLDTGTANVSSVNGAELVVNGGTLVVTNNSSIGSPAAGLLVSGGSATYLGSLNSTVNSGTAGYLIASTGGTLTAGSMAIGRSGLNFGSQPAAGSTTIGLYVNGGAVNIITNLNMSTSGNANSSVSARIDSGSLTVGGNLTIGLNNGGRWSVMDVNGGTLTVTNETTGINVGGPLAGNALLLVRAGVVNAGIIGLGNTLQTNGDTAVLNVTNGSLYVGAGGIVQVSSNVTPVITLYGGLLGASADWACSNNIVLGNPTIQAADSLSVAHNIALSGILSGTNLTKTGSGTLTLSAANTYSGITTIGNGTLTLSTGSSIAGTTRVGIGAGATFDVSALGGYTFTGAGPVQTLAGTSTSGAGNVAVGGNTVTLNSGAGTLFQANGSSSTIGKISVAGNVTLNNNTVTINVTGSPLGGGTNRLLDCTGTLTGSANITPVFTGLGLASGSATVVTTTGSNGHVDLVVNSALIPTQSAGITGFSLAGNNVVLNGTNGQSGGTYYLLTSTNIADPIGIWTAAATNIITTNGVGGAFTFTGTNVVNPNDAQQYYILSNTNNH
jgi:autotransporter-associated beta strand protein